MCNRAAQHVRDRQHLLRSITGCIDDRVETAAAKRREIPVAVAAQLLDLGKEVWVLPAAVEKDDFMPPWQGGFDNVPTEKECSAEDQDSHDIGSPTQGVTVLKFRVLAAIWPVPRPTRGRF
jgi:hypothetical protein